MVGIAGSAEHRTAEKLLLNLSARFLIFKKTETKPTLSEGVAALCVSCESGTEGGCLYLCPSEFAKIFLKSCCSWGLGWVGFSHKHVLFVG